MQQQVVRILAIGALVAAIVACTPAAAAPSGAPLVDEARATEIAENAFAALNRGDYAGYSRDWSDTMKSAIKERDFLAFRETVLGNLGRYVSIEGVERNSVKPGTYRFTFRVAFEKGTATFAFGYHDGGTKVEGVFAS